MSTIQDINCTHGIRNGLVLQHCNSFWFTALCLYIVVNRLEILYAIPNESISLLKCIEICELQTMRSNSTPEDSVQIMQYSVSLINPPTQKKQRRNSKVILKTKQDNAWLSNGNQAEFPSRQCKSKLNFEQNDMKCLTDQWFGQFLSQCRRS